ncbi:TRAP transporter permease [Brackiella oedipodis]|uniref:TRAP transporter permease n=1 Tax=Brackiella oedipodis TaxID=124225 RepID=UPI00048F6C4C|nr:TRAP transporter permease [Brackiella oedipodis]
MTDVNAVDNEKLEQLVADSDRGGRNVSGIAASILATCAILWSCFQLWIASPLPFTFGFGIFNDTEARAVHLGFAMFLGYLAFPMLKKNTNNIPIYDWILALVAGFCGAYLCFFYNDIALRPGMATQTDVVVGVLGLLLLLEITRRALGKPMAVLALLFLLYAYFGPYMPDVIAHRGASLTRIIDHMWLSTEGTYGVALGVSVSYIFIFVLFGSLLDRCGAGNYFMQVSFAFLGHLRGGPAKVAVVSSCMNGIVSGSSVANVVTGGVFTIPLMKRAGYGGLRAGAIETAASVDGQIMPPVMGAAAFLMTEYVGISYQEVIRHALLPAILSYIGLFAIVHIEALKLGLQPMASAHAPRTPLQRLLRFAMGISLVVIVVAGIYWIGEGVKMVAGKNAVWILLLLMFVLYVYLLRVAAKYPDLPTDITITSKQQPQAWPTVRAGLFYLIPVGVLIWSLSVERLSPGLSAFYAVLSILFLMITQQALFAWFRKQALKPALGQGLVQVKEGLEQGARNMIGIALACGTAGIIVGVVTLTGLGLRMTAFIELISMGNLLFMLFFTAFVCLVLGLGMPTTANYILMATLMAPVVVELSAQNGLIIPLVAVHMFVFYFGIMADITPPVGLATFAAAAISGEDPIKTGIKGVAYAFRTIILPFVFIFNPLLLLIGIENWGTLVIVVAAAIVGSIVFAAATLNWFRTKCNLFEIFLLLLATALMYRPDWFMDRLMPEFVDRPASQAYQIAATLPENHRFVAQIEGSNLEGDLISKTVAVNLQSAPAKAGDDLQSVGRDRLTKAGLMFSQLGDQVKITNVRFGSLAKRSSWELGWDLTAVKIDNPQRPTPLFFFLPGLLVIYLVWRLQGRRQVKLERQRRTEMTASKD